MNKKIKNIAYVLANDAALGETFGIGDIPDTDVIFSKGIFEAEKFLFDNQPDLLIIDRAFLEYNGVKFDRISRLYTGIKFIPVLYVGSKSDEEYVLLSHFKEIVTFEAGESDQMLSKAKEYLEPSVRVRFWGVRGSTPCANYENIQFGGNTSCVEIDLPGVNELLILDSGTGIRNLGNFLHRKNEYNFIGNIFITHPHWDHIQGFPFFKPLYSSDNKFTIYLPEQYRGGAQEILSGHLTKTFFPVTLDMLSAEMEYVTQGEDVTNFGEYTVEYMVANHPTKTAMYKIKLHGLTIIYAPDNELPMKSTPIRFIDNFKEFVKDCDLLIHDGQFSQKLYEQRVGWGHSAWERVVDVTKKCNVKNLVITHHDPDSDDDLLHKREEMLKQYEGDAFESVSLAKEGSEIRLPIKK